MGNNTYLSSHYFIDIAAVLNHLLEIKKTFVMVTNMQPGNLSKFVRTLEAAGLKVVIQLLASERVVPLNY